MKTTLEYIFLKHIPHIAYLDVSCFPGKAIVFIRLKWYEFLTFGILRDRTEQRLVDLWSRLHPAGQTLEIVFVR